MFLYRIIQWFFPSPKSPSFPLSKKANNPSNGFVLTVDDQGVTCCLPDGTDNLCVWDRLQEIRIVTTAGGPYALDVWYFLLETDGKSSRFPIGAVNEKAFQDYIFALPGFDFTQYISAMGSAEENVFVCWRKHGAASMVNP